MDAYEFLTQFHDYLAPKLDPYEQVIYLYVVRHSRLLGQDDVTIGIGSAAKKGVFGTGNTGDSMSPGNCRKKLRSLELKGCLTIVASEHHGFRIQAKLPCEIGGLIPPPVEHSQFDLEEINFFDDPKYRPLILEREQHKCFYCLRSIDNATYVLEHVISRPRGNNSYRNVVAGCRQCNNRKGSSTAEDFLRTLYRESFLSSSELEDRLSHLERLRAGELKPSVIKH